MVILQYKKTEFNQFLYSTSLDKKIEEVLAELVEAIDKLSVSLEDLATYGVMKPEELRGLTDEENIKYALEMMPEEKRKLFAQKPTPGPNQRFGVILSEETTKIILNEVEKAKTYISSKKVDSKLPLSIPELKEILNNLRGALMIGYPGYYGLPVYEPARLICEGKFEFDIVNDMYDFLSVNNTTIWWAGKELLAGKTLKEYVGKNEKTKIVIKLQKSGSGAPCREPLIDEETHKKMLAFYHKKQEEQKKLEDDNDDNYLNAQWANPKNLKNQLIGGGKEISWKPR